MSQSVPRVLKDLFKEHAQHFQYMTGYLLTCFSAIESFPRSKLSFPPTTKECEHFVKELLQQLERQEGDASSSPRDIVAFYDKGIDDLKLIDPKGKNSFEQMITYCSYMRELYSVLLATKSKLNSKTVLRTEKLTRETISKAHRLIGYWTSKMEVKERARKSASVKSVKRAANKEIIEEMLKKSGGEENRDFVRKAMEEIDRGERTVKNLIKEIQIQRKDRD